MTSMEEISEQDVLVAAVATEGEGKETTNDSVDQHVVLPPWTTEGESFTVRMGSVSIANENDTPEGVIGKSDIVHETRNDSTQVWTKDEEGAVSPNSAHCVNCNGNDLGRERLAFPSNEKMASNEHNHDSDVCVTAAFLKIDDSFTLSGIQDAGNIPDYAPHMEKINTLCLGRNGSREEKITSPSVERYPDERHQVPNVGIGICPVHSDDVVTNFDDVTQYEEEKMEMKPQETAHVKRNFSKGIQQPNNFVVREKGNSEAPAGAHQKIVVAELSKECIEPADNCRLQLSVTQEAEQQKVSGNEISPVAINSAVYPEVETTVSQSNENEPHTSMLEEDMLFQRGHFAVASVEEGGLYPCIIQHMKQQDLFMEKAAFVEDRLAKPEVEADVSPAVISLQNRNSTGSFTFDGVIVIENAESESKVCENSMIVDSSYNLGEISKSIDENLLGEVNEKEATHHSIESIKGLGLRDHEGSDCEEDKSNGNTLNSFNEINAFEIDDLVWAKVRSHPWWPAQILDPQDASTSVIKLRKAGRYLVAFFGDYTFAWLQQAQLQAFKPNFKEKVKQTMMKGFCKAVNEALEELCLRSELGLACKHFKGALCSRSIFKDVGKIQTHKDVVSSINMFDTRKTLGYLKDAACSPVEPWVSTLETSALRGHAYGLRNCMIFSKWNIDCKQVQELSFDEVIDDLTKGSKRKRTSSLESTGNESEESKKSAHKVHKVDGSSKKVVRDENGLTTGMIDFHKEHCTDHDSVINKAKQNSISKKNMKNSHTARVSAFTDSAIRDFEMTASASPSDSELFQPDKVKAYDSMNLKLIRKENGSPSKKETKGNKSNKLLKFGDTMRKVASELTGALPIGKCFGKSSSKRMGSTSKKHTDSRSPSKASLMQIYEGLSNSARDPLSYSDINPQQDRTIEAILKFRDEVYLKNTDISEDIIVASDEMKRERGKHQTQGSDDNVKPVPKATYHYIRKRKFDVQEDVKREIEGVLNSDSDGDSAFGSVTNIQNFTETRRLDKHMVKYCRRSAVSGNDSESPVELDEVKTSSRMPVELFMKFPRDRDLPSVSELNDKFMSFGSLQLSETRADRDSAAALVVFKDGQDAESAWKYAMENPMFGDIEVTYKLQHISQPSETEIKLVEAEESFCLQGEPSLQHGFPRTDIDQIEAGPSDGGISNVNVVDETANMQGDFYSK